MENEESYKDLFDNAHDLIHLVKPDGTLLYVNNAWLKTLEYSINEIKEKSVIDLVDDTDKEKFVQYRENILLGNDDKKEIIVGLKAKSGRLVIVEGFISAKVKNGIPLYTRGIFRDITARIQNEEQIKIFTARLKEREDNLQQLITNAPDAIIVINAQSKILLWNPKAEEIFGWKSEEVVGRQLQDTIIPHMYREAHSKGMQRYLHTGETHVLNKSIEITALNKKGEEFYIALTISNTRQAGNPAFVAFIRDISQQKKNELELERNRKELELSNRELEQYSWLTSHDLKEPLRKILTYSDLILTQTKTPVPEGIQKYVVKIFESGRRMGKLIESMLTYSSLTNEQQLFKKTDLNDVVKGVLSDLELLIQENNAVVQMSDLPVIEAAPLQMRQLFQNLISNSIKYRRPDVQPHIDINADQSDSNMVQLFVKDNGIGLEQDDLEKIFRLFQRVKTATRIEGSGIGLAICKKIVERHHGSIKVASTPQVGTTFTITLPRKFE